MSWWTRLGAWFRNETPWYNECRWKVAYVSVCLREGPADDVWESSVIGAVRYLNTMIGREFLVFRRVDTTYVQGFMATGHGYVGDILVMADNEDGRKGHALPVYNKKLGSIRSGVIALPARVKSLNVADSDEARTLTSLSRIPMHELGHMLGLGHARNPRSFMWHNATESEFMVLAHEQRMIRAAYGNIQV